MRLPNGDVVRNQLTKCLTQTISVTLIVAFVRHFTRVLLVVARNRLARMQRSVRLHLQNKVGIACCQTSALRTK